MAKRWNVIASALLCSLFSVGCIPGVTNNTTPVSNVRNASGDIQRVMNTEYDANSKVVTLHTQSAPGNNGEDMVDVSNTQGIVNYAITRYPKQTIQSVRVVRANRMAPVAGFVGQTVASSAQYVETRGGWVSYHTAPRLQSSVAGRLRSGQRALLVRRANAYWYEVNVNGRNVYITTNSRYTQVVGAPAVLAPGAGGTVTPPTPTQTPVPAPSPTPSTTSVPPSISQPPAAPPPTSNQSTISLPPPGVHMDSRISAAAGPNTTRTQKANAVLQVATSKLGTPYVWGHNEDRGQYGFDCSNFTEYVYHHALGYLCTSWSRGQYTSVGVPVPNSQMQVGDLLIFNSGGHVGIYAGNGQMIQEGGGLGKVGYLRVTPGSYWGNHLSVVKRMF